MKKIAKITTLEEVILWAKNNNVKLNIELKNNNHQINLVKSVVDLINKHNYKKNILLASQNYNFLIDIKKYDDEIKTVFVCRKLENTIDFYKYADIFSIKKTEINSEIVKQIHKIGKKVYVWTILSEDEVMQMCDYNVDNIIANDIEKVKIFLKNCYD